MKAIVDVYVLDLNGYAHYFHFRSMRTHTKFAGKHPIQCRL